MSHPPCRSGKRHFPTRHDAEHAMHTIWRANTNAGVLPSRVYACRCGSWHLTSKPYRFWERDETTETRTA